MPNRVCVIDMPGLSRELLAHVPPESALAKWLADRPVHNLTPSFPALTCSIQATLTTGKPPSDHGIIANGLPTFRSQNDQSLIDASNFAEYRKSISFWEQSNQLLDVPRFWQTSTGQSRWKTSLLFFQNSMPGFASPQRPAADIVFTPKPDHGPDGKLTSLCWSNPPDLVPALFKQLGPFPLMNYWGPMANIKSSQWIAHAAATIWTMHAPQLQWVYIPHLDYDLQRFGPSSPQAARAVAEAAGALDPLLAAVNESNGQIALLSEYAMREVNRCIHPNRVLSTAGLLTTRPSPDGPIVDYEKSLAFAMVDHQIAHVYCKDANSTAAARAVLEVDGVASAIFPPPELKHRRSGDFLLLAQPDTWFDYRWWTDPAAAPTFAKLVDIHRKPGYDPLELFWDRAANSVSQDPSLIHGSHGLAEAGEAIWVMDESPQKTPAQSVNLNATDIASIITRALA